MCLSSAKLLPEKHRAAKRGRDHNFQIPWLGYSIWSVGMRVYEEAKKRGLGKGNCQIILVSGGAAFLGECFVDGLKTLRRILIPKNALKF